jgi:branched-chain amino acid transport system substrate-binding protein
MGMGTKMRMRSRMVAGAGAILLAGGVLAACSSSKHAASTSPTTSSAGSSPASSSPASSSPATSAGAQATGTPLKIGVIGGFTGPLASSVYAALPAIQAWSDYVNANGGVNGHPVQLVVDDDLSNPGTSVTDAQSLVSQHVLALFDISNFDAQWSAMAAQNHVPIIPMNSTTVGTLTSTDFFTPGETIDALPTAVAQAANKVGAKKLALLYCSESPACSELTPPIKKEATANGVQMVYSDAISATSPGYTAPCLAAQQSGAQAMFVGDAVSVLISVAKDCTRQGFKPVFIGDDGAVAPSFASSAGWSNGMIAEQPNIPFFVDNTPATIAMYNAFKQYKPGFITNPNFNELAVEAWAAGKLFELAAKDGQLGMKGEPTTAELYNGLYSPALQGQTLDGLAPPLHFTQGKTNTNDCWFWMRTDNGKFTTPYGLTPTCSPAAA